MRWELDEQTRQAATKYPIAIQGRIPVGPFEGRTFYSETWNDRVVQPADWGNVTRSDPDDIIKQFQRQRYTQGLALVASWGTMWRKPDAIWGNREVEGIEMVLGKCAQSIQSCGSIADSWTMMRKQLAWTSVLISKTLHFLCLSLGFDHDPPVPIDGKVIRQTVWPAFVRPIPVSERPRSWNGDSLAAYNRYMTAILTWAARREWRTFDVERTICAEFEPSWRSECASAR